MDIMVVFQTMLKLFLLLILGFVLFKCHIFDEYTNKKISAFNLANLISQNLKDYPTISNCIWDLVCKEKLKSDLQLAKVTMNSFVELACE